MQRLTEFNTPYMVATGSEDLSSFASVAGMSAQEFSQAWGEDAVGALSAFIDGLAEIDDAGGSSVAVLNELGISESRMSTAVQSLAASHGILNRALSTADQAWKNNSALMREASTRYQTTESRVQMCKNALEGLKVTVGKQLTPALGNIADAGKNAMKVASDFVETNRWLVPTITGLTSALSVGAAALAGYTAITKLAIPAITAFNTALAANPWGAVALGAAAAITAITTLVITLKDDAIPTVDELTDAAQALPEAFGGANSTLEENSTSIQATAAVVSDYIDRLSELESQGLTTAAAQEEYRQILDQIRYLLPDISLELDVQTGKIIGGSAALRDYVDNWKEAAVQQALIENYQAKIKAYSDAEVEAATNTARFTFALAEEKSIKEQIAAVTDQMSKYQAKNNAILEDSTLTAIEADKARQQLNLEYTEQAMRLKELQDKLKDNQQEQERLNAAAAVSAENMSAFTAEVDLAEEALTQYNATLGSSSGVTAENASAVAAIKGELTGLAQSYKEAYDAAASSIEGQIGLFDTFAAEISADTDTVEEMMARWGEQTENLAKYTEDLKKAAQYGLDDGLIQSLSDGSASSAGYLSTIIAEIERLGGTTEGMSGEASAFVDEFNAAFERTGEAKESFALTVAAIQSDLEATVVNLEEIARNVDFSGFNEALESAFANVGIVFQDIGINIGAGLTQGLGDSSKDVAVAARDVADTATKSAKEALGEHSPSTVWREIGENADFGLAQGIKSKTSNVISEISQLSQQMERDMKSGASKSVKAFDGEFSQITSRTASRLSSLQSTISSATSGLPGTMNSVGIQMINGMISGLNSRSSALYSTVRSIVNQAIDAAKKAAAVRSPSKKTTEIFEQVGEGMVVGLENKREKVSETVQSVVNDALKLELKMPEIPKIDDRMPRIEFPQQADP